jgi:hypothetical protein
MSGSTTGGGPAMKTTGPTQLPVLCHLQRREHARRARLALWKKGDAASPVFEEVDKIVATTAGHFFAVVTAVPDRRHVNSHSARDDCACLTVKLPTRLNYF